MLALGSAGLAVWAVRSSQVAAQTDPQSAHGRDAMSTARTYVATVMTYDVKDYADLDRRIADLKKGRRMLASALDVSERK